LKLIKICFHFEEIKKFIFLKRRGFRGFYTKDMKSIG